MRLSLLRFPMLLTGAAALALPAAAQDKSSDQNKCDCGSLPRVMRTFSYHTRDDNRAALGLATTSGSLRDTLGLLVTEVTSSGPAEKAGIEEGDRLQAVNGVDLRVSAADAGDREIHGLMSHRLIRTLAKIKPGDPVELRVYTDGKVRTVKVVTAKASDLFKDDGVMRLGSEWFGPGDFGDLHGRMDHLLHQMDGLRLKVDRGPFKFRTDPNDIEFMPDEPTPPLPPSAPSAPSAPSRHFMRIGAPPAPPAPRAPLAPPVPPATPVIGFDTITI